MWAGWRVIAVLGLAVPLAACRPVDLPLERRLPGLPEELRQLPEAWNELGLPDLQDLSEMPGLDTLPLFREIPGGLVYQGPTERKIVEGEPVPGTDMDLVRVKESTAEFRIADMNASKTIGDSLDYDGPWPGLPGVTYHARLRVYHVGEGIVRAAGVHRLLIEDVEPRMRSAQTEGVPVRFPFAAAVDAGGTIPGTTYTYTGSEDRGAEFGGMPDGEYPFRKLGDSLRWAGQLRSDIGAEYDVRVLYYDSSSAKVGGVVTVYLPNN